MKTNLKAVSCIAAFLFALPASPLERHGGSAASPRPSSLQAPNSAPPGFIPNVGQYPHSAATFVARDKGLTAYFSDKGFQLWNGQTVTVSKDGTTREVPVAPRWELEGAHPVKPAGGRKFEHTVSFFQGSDPAKWHVNVPAYRDLRYPEILKGVELRLESREHGFEYSFHISPHSKPDLRFRYDGITGLGKSPLGDLVVRTAAGQFTESRPVSYQMIEGQRVEVASAFEIVSPSEYRITAGPHDERYELVVDPVLDWSSSLGGSFQDQLNVVKFDPAGDVIVAGVSFSQNLPANAAFAPFDSQSGNNIAGNTMQSDIYIAKFSADGSQLRWAGYIGGAGATSDAVGRSKGLAIDPATGDIYLAGHTKSPDFPIWPAGSSTAKGGIDSIAMKIKADGSAILWSRRVGGSGADYGWTLSVSGDDLYFAGVTTSADFASPAAMRSYAGLQDGFVVKLSAATGVPAWSSFLGGSRDERVGAVSADASGVIVYGDTDSDDFHGPDFPAPAPGHRRTLGGNNDAFLTRFDPAGNIGWSTYLGGSQAETVSLAPLSEFPLSYSFADLTRDSLGNIIAVGLTFSPDFPNTSGSAQPNLAGANDAYIAKVSADGTQVLWATYLGGSGQHDGAGREDLACGVAVNEWDEVFVVGGTLSPNFPTSADALKKTLRVDGTQDASFAKLSSDGKQILYATYAGNDGWNDGVLSLDYGHGHAAFCGWHFDAFVHATPGAAGQECDNCGSDAYLMNFIDSYIAYDGFESGYGAGDGWSGAWTQTGDNDIITASGPHTGAQHVRLRRGTGVLQRTASVAPGTSTLKLGFWSKLSSFEGSEHATVTVSVSGGGSAQVNYSDDENIYRYREIDLTSLLPNPRPAAPLSVQVTFDANMSDTGDQWYLDDVRLFGTSEPLPPIANAGPDQTVADADSDGFAAVTLDGSGSSDPDGGGITSFQWSGAVVGTGPSITATLPVGIHTVTLTVTDDEGATSSDTVQITVTAPPPPMHSADLDGSSANSGKNWKATVVVTIHDQNHSAVPGATVSIPSSGGFSAASRTTDSNGRCTFTSNSLNKQIPNATLTIMNVSHPAFTYRAADNHDPDSDSDGTAITVLKP